MTDFCLSAAAITVVGAMIGGLCTAIIALYRRIIAQQEREIARWQELAMRGNQGWADANQTARRAKASEGR